MALFQEVAQTWSQLENLLKTLSPVTTRKERKTYQAEQNWPAKTHFSTDANLVIKIHRWLLMNCILISLI